MNPTEEMLRAIYLSARCGCEAINSMLPKITNTNLLTETTAQLNAYAEYGARAEQMMQDKSLGKPDFPLKSKLAVRGGVMLETMGTPAQSELSRLLRVSSRESAKRMRSAVADLSNDGCDQDALALGQRMLAYEVSETERLGALQCE